MFRSKLAIAVVAVVALALALGGAVALSDPTARADPPSPPMHAGQHMMTGACGAQAAPGMAMPAMPMQPEQCPTAGQNHPMMPGMPHGGQGMIGPHGSMSMPGPMRWGDMPMMPGGAR
jgi:hypothetical protein